MTQLAQVQYRDYVDRYTFALKFLDINFSGSEAETLKRQWYELDYRDVNVREERLSELREQLEVLEALANQLQHNHDQLDKARFYPVNWFNNDFKARRSKAWSDYINAVSEETMLRKEIKHFRISDPIDQSKDKKNHFLLENGFTLVSSHFQTHNHITVEEWVKNE